MDDERALWPKPARTEWSDEPDRTVTRDFALLTPAARMDWLEEMADIRWRAMKRNVATA